MVARREGAWIRLTPPDNARSLSSDSRRGPSRASSLPRPDDIACPSCGRTLFDLEEVTARIKSATSHLKSVEIAIMGCVVNGPGEMADADFGYVGSAPGRINLYVKKDCVEKNLPAEVAGARLIELIKQHGAWVEPPAEGAA
jgi:(E)-4-hydroxy-3-methylbut-2-enyl-diphosphate synthase